MITSSRAVRTAGAFLAVTLALASALPALADTPSPVPVPEPVKAWSALTLKESRPVENLKLTVGHVTLTLTGDAAYVVAGSDAVGLFFKGEGTLEYTSVDPVEFPVLSYNVGKNTGLKPVVTEKSVTLKDKLEEVLWLAAAGPLPTLPATGDGKALGEAFAAHLKQFGKIDASPIAHQFAGWKLNAPDKTLVRAEIAGGDEDLLYVFDDLDDRSEGLYRVHKSSFKDPALSDRLVLTALSDQPIGRDRRDPLVPRYVLSDVDLEVAASDGKDVSITATETFRVTRDKVGMLSLGLYDTRFAYNNLGSLVPRTLKVTKVLDEAGKPLPFHHAKDEVVVILPAPVPAGGTFKVRFETQGDILFRPGGDSYWELGVEPWFPQPDLSGQYFTVHCTARVKKPFVPFAPGKTIRRVVEGDENVLETRIDKPVQFMVVLAGKYSFEEDTQNGVTVRIASYGGKDTMGIRKLTKLTHKIIDYYAGFLGPFPFDEMNVIEINSWGFGQAPPGFMFITSEAFNPIGGQVNQLFSQGVNERFAHEIAHQYWGHVVKMASYEEQWLTESFAEISAGLFIRELRGKGDLEGLETHWRSRAKEAVTSAPIPLANRLRNKSDGSTAASYRTSLLYSKGPWILDAIRKDIGDQPFLVFLSSCQSTFRWKFGSTKMVAAVLEAVTKKDWKPFFESNYWGTGMPK